MRRIGKFTGRIYDEDYDFSECPECCKVITDDVANNPNLIEFLHTVEKQDCKYCLGCPAAQDNK